MVRAATIHPRLPSSVRRSGTVQPVAAYPYAWGSPSVSRVSSVASAPESSRRAWPGCPPSATPATPSARQAATQLCTLVSVQSKVCASVATGTPSARSKTA